MIGVVHLDKGVGDCPSTFLWFLSLCLSVSVYNITNDNDIPFDYSIPITTIKAVVQVAVGFLKHHTSLCYNGTVDCFRILKWMRTNMTKCVRLQ